MYSQFMMHGHKNIKLSLLLIKDKQSQGPNLRSD